MKITGSRYKLLEVKETNICTESQLLKQASKFFQLMEKSVQKLNTKSSNVKTRINKAKAAFSSRKSNFSLSVSTTIRIFNTHAKSLLLYGADTRITTQLTIKKIRTFINSCPKRILQISRGAKYRHQSV